jgi:hypothetical protein
VTQAAIEINGQLAPMGENYAVPGALDFPLDASEQAAKGQYLTLDPTTGMASLADDNVPGQISAGYVSIDELTTVNATAGNARARVSQRWAHHATPSTIASDGFTAADVGVPFFLADANTPGKLSHTSTKNRTLGGLVFGLVKTGSLAIYHWAGPVAQAIARGVMAADMFPGGSLSKVIDAGATTDTVNGLAEAMLDNLAAVHGKVAAVKFSVEGTTLAASGATDYGILTLWKRPAVGGTPVQVATIDTTVTAFTKWETVNFTLSVVAGATDTLETDQLTLIRTHGGAGAVIPAGKVRVFRKVG